MADVALDQLVLQDTTAALRALLAQWRETFNPALGRWLETLGERLVVPLDDLPLKKGERSARLAELAKTADVPERTAVLQAFEAFAREATGALVWPAVEVWAEVEPDPRVARMALRVLTVLEHQLTAKLWRRLVGCIERHGDTGVSQEAQPYLEKLRQRGATWGYSVARVENVLAKLGKKRPPVPIDPELLDRLGKAIDASSEAHGRDVAAVKQTGEAMLEAILAAPDDDTPRLVYADWLTERRSPLGEFITLQVSRAGKRPTKDARERESQLLASHRQALLGPFDGVMAKNGLVFERGFLVEGIAVKPLPAHPLTRLLRSVTFKSEVGPGVRLDRLEEATGPSLRHGAASLPQAAPGLKRWAIDARTPERVTDCLVHARLDELRLRTIVSGALSDALAAVFSTPCGKGLSALTVEVTSVVLLALRPGTVPATLKRFTLELAYHGDFTWTRTAAGWTLVAQVRNATLAHRISQGLAAVLPALGPVTATTVRCSRIDRPRLGPELSAMSSLGALEWVVR